MKDKQLYLYWLYLAILCATLGFIQDRNPLVVALLCLASLAFFVPGGILLYRDIRSGGKQNLKIILWGSVLSLVLTAVLFIGYWFSLAAASSDLPGRILYAALTVVSTPMMCAPYPAVSMFLWACMLFTAITYLKPTKTRK
jgi:hypothetical protein